MLRHKIIKTVFTCYCGKSSNITRYICSFHLFDNLIKYVCFLKWSLFRGGSRGGGPGGPGPPWPPKLRPQHQNWGPRMAVLGRSRSGPPPDQILDPPLLLLYHFLRANNSQGQIQDFPLGGTNPHWRGHQPLTQALFGENICKNERIWSCWGGGGRVLETFVCRSATDSDHTCIKILKHLLSALQSSFICDYLCVKITINLDYLKKPTLWVGLGEAPFIAWTWNLWAYKKPITNAKTQLLVAIVMKTLLQLGCHSNLHIPLATWVNIIRHCLATAVSELPLTAVAGGHSSQRCCPLMSQLTPPPSMTVWEITY